MSKKLVAYFSASGITAKVAEDLADAIGADIFEIRPEVPYTKADLNWMDKKSRSTIEMSNPDSRPAIAAKRDNMDEYDTIFVGFPIWWYIAPTIINTFLESYDLKNKTIIPFATSGGSDMGKTNEKLAPSCPGSKLLHGKVFNASSTKADLSAWVDSHIVELLFHRSLRAKTGLKPLLDILVSSNFHDTKYNHFDPYTRFYNQIILVIYLS